MSRAVNTIPVVPYPRLVGEVLQHRREALGLYQSQLASALSVTQSAYSRIEKGETTVSVSQLRMLAHTLGTTPGNLLAEADQWALQLSMHGVNVIDSKEVSPAAILIGLGILAALLASASKGA